MFRTRASKRMEHLCKLAMAAAMSLAAAITLSATVSAQSAQSRIAFEREGSIWIMNADGTEQTNLTGYYFGREPSFSRDGRKIVFTCGTETGDICTIDSAGGEVAMLTSTGNNSSPAFSSDGKKIVFTSRRDFSAGIYVMNADGSGVVKLDTGNPGGYDDEYPTWSPDGLRIAFVRNAAEILTVKADGSGDLQLVTASEGYKQNLAYSPDGSQIAFDDVNDVYVVSAAGGGAPMRLTTTGTQSYDPAWSPDGLRIAFHRLNVTYENGEEVRERGLYVMQANGLGLASLNCLNAYAPTWANVSNDPDPEPEPEPEPEPGPTPAERVASLIEVLKGFNLHHGMANSLLVKLNHARDALVAGNNAAACDNLASFINQVGAQSGKKLTTAQAAQLADEATLIRSAIGCQ